jgi:hypothetical protein
MTSDSLHRRSRQSKSRWLARRREFRERHLAAGVWFRLRRCLAHAARAFIIPAEAAAALEQDGLVPERPGLDLEPPLRLYVVTPERLASISGRREIRVRLSAELLTAGQVALVPFDPP